MRKSPVKHKVRRHTRESGEVIVTSYQRGKGKPIPVRFIKKRKPLVTRQRTLTTTEKKGTMIKHKTAGTVAEIVDSIASGFAVHVIEDGIIRGLPFKDVRKWDVLPSKAVTDETPIGAKAFTINFKYSNKKDDGESVIVFADTYKKALDEGFEERVDKHRVPLEVEIIDPLLGAALSIVARAGRGVGSLAFRGVIAAAKLGATYAVKGAQAVPGVLRKVGAAEKRIIVEGAKLGKRAVIEGAKISKRVAIEAGHTAWTELQKRDAQRLLEKAYSRDKAEAYFAKQTLKRKYPYLYDKSSFSRY